MSTPDQSTPNDRTPDDAAIAGTDDVTPDANTPDPGPQPSPPRTADDPLGVTDDASAGTGQGDPLAGVLIDERDAQQAVSADE
ncbi:hypothetical protein [Kineococcus sp. G2]|uniref:hypothetical protein n=1 Tax=Kineococcus sp. G2 TaxID=3127484 RepID=UPI00301E1FB6